MSRFEEEGHRTVYLRLERSSQMTSRGGAGRRGTANRRMDQDAHDERCSCPARKRNPLDAMKDDTTGSRLGGETAKTKR